MSMFRRFSAYVGAAAPDDTPVETSTIEVLCGKVTINEVFEPKSVWVCVTVLSSNQTNQTHVTKRATKQIKLAQSYTNQWMFRDKVDLPKAAKVQIELRCHFDETNAFGGVLLADAVVAVSSLTHFSTDIEMDMKDISGALNVVNSEYGKSSGSVYEIERAYIQQATLNSQSNGALSAAATTAGTKSASSVEGTGEVGSKAGAKCAVTLRLKYVSPEPDKVDPSSTAMTATASTTGNEAATHDPHGSTSHSEKHETSRVHKISVGKLCVTLWQGKSLNTSCPVFVCMFLNTLRAKGCRSPSKPNPHNPVFDYFAEVDIYSLQADLVIEVWEEQMAGANKLGQTVIPVSWLLHQASLSTLLSSQHTDSHSHATSQQQHPQGNSHLDLNANEMSISSWFEIFPPVTPTPFNRGGQYRPYYKGLPISGTGYGLLKPDKSIGFLKLDVCLQLKESFALTLLRNPWVYAAREPDVHLDEEEFALKAILVAGFTLLDIFNYLWDPPILRKLFEILNWHTHPALSGGMLYLFSYLALIAQPWQYPYVLLVMVTIIGLAAAADRNFDDVKVFTQDKASKDKDQEGEANKSYAEMYKEMKGIALTMEKSVSLAYNILTKANNLLMGSDPILSGITFVLLLFIAVCVSLMLCVFTPNQVFWFGGLSFFTPPELQDYIVDSMFQQMTKMQEYVLGFATRRRGQHPHDAQPNEAVAAGGGDSTAINNSDSKTQTVTFADNKSIRRLTSSIDNNSKDTAPAAGIGRSRSTLSSHPTANTHRMQDDDDASEFVERQTFRTTQLFSYNWLKAQTYKWLKMVPDDIELKHRHICGVARVSKQEMYTRLPQKKKAQIQTNTSHTYTHNYAHNNDAVMSALLNAHAISQARYTNSFSSTQANTLANAQQPSSSSFSDYVSNWMRPSGGTAPTPKRSFSQAPSQFQRTTSNRSLATDTSDSATDSTHGADKDSDSHTPKHTTKRHSWRGSGVDDVMDASPMSAFVPRTLGEMFPNKCKPIVISISDPSQPHAQQASALDANKVFTLTIHIVAARGLNVKESLTKSIGSMAAVRSKIYADVTIQPVSACNVFFRTGGQPRGPNPQFREEFVFDAVGEDAMFIVIEITRKSAMQAKGWETFLGQAIISFESIVRMWMESMSSSSTNNEGGKYGTGPQGMPGEVSGWFPLVDKTTGEQLGSSEINLSLEIGTNSQ